MSKPTRRDSEREISKVWAWQAVSEKSIETVSISNGVKQARKFWHILGPGLTTGAADDDPSGIATYSQTGSRYGFNLLWLSAFTFPLMAIVQEMCARIGMVTGRGLAANIKKHFPRWILYLTAFLLLAANTFNIGADLGIMAKSTQLLLPELNFSALIIFFTAFSLALQIFLTYGRYAKYLKWLALVLLSYVLTLLLVKIDGHQLILSALVPHLEFSKDQIFLVCGILGTTISPYLFFWQTSQEVEEEILEGKTTISQRRAVTGKEIKKMRLDVWAGMFFSNLVMFCIIATCGATLFANGINDIQSAADAAAALRPLAGDYAFFLFAAGIIGVGLLAIPILAGGVSYAFAETFGWKQGLYKKLNQAKAFYGVIILSMALGLLMNFVNLDPIKALIYAAVINGIVAPVIIILIVKISGNKKIMGIWANRPIMSAMGWLTTVIMSLVAMATIFFSFR